MPLRATKTMSVGRLLCCRPHRSAYQALTSERGLTRLPRKVGHGSANFRASPRRGADHRERTHLVRPLNHRIAGWWVVSKIMFESRARRFKSIVGALVCRALYGINVIDLERLVGTLLNKTRRPSVAAGRSRWPENR